MSKRTSIDRLEQQWTTLGANDPLWAVLSYEEKKNGRWNADDFFATGTSEIERALSTAEMLCPVHFGTALDFGCGVGRLSQALAQRFGVVIGVDIAAPMLAAAQVLNRFPDVCSFIHNVRPDLNVIATESVDLVYSSITLQHISPPLIRSYIREFFRVARRGGHVIFQVPSGPRSRIRQFIKRLLPISLTNFLWRIRTGSPEAMEAHFIVESEVIQLVRDSGGAVERVEPNYDGPAGWPSRRYFCTKTVSQAGGKRERRDGPRFHNHQ